MIFFGLCELNPSLNGKKDWKRWQNKCPCASVKSYQITQKLLFKKIIFFSCTCRTWMRISTVTLNDDCAPLKISLLILFRLYYLASEAEVALWDENLLVNHRKKLIRIKHTIQKWRRNLNRIAHVSSVAKCNYEAYLFFFFAVSVQCRN